jgi:predicted dehydrogenase
VPAPFDIAMSTRSVRFDMVSDSSNIPFTPIDRPVRVAIIGLGHVYELNIRAYLDNPDVEVLALVDPSEDRRHQRQIDWPDATTFETVEHLATSGLAIDAVEVLVPWTLHEDVVTKCLANGWHVNLQKPFAIDLASASRMTDAAERSGRQLRIMENYLFYEPLVKLKEVVDSGELGEIGGYHMKMVASGRGGWDVPGSSFDWRFEQALLGRGTLFFDDGWHKVSTALWLFGPVDEVRAWIGTTEIIPGVVVDSPTTVSWTHTNGVRGVWDITLAVDMYMRSDYFTNDERWEVTGRRGFARVNRCTARGLQQPSLEVYRDGEMRSFHALDDDWGNSFRDSGRHWLDFLRTGNGPLCWGPNEATTVLRFALAAYESSSQRGVGVDPNSVNI